MVRGIGSGSLSLLTRTGCDSALFDEVGRTSIDEENRTVWLDCWWCCVVQRSRTVTKTERMNDCGAFFAGEDFAVAFKFAALDHDITCSFNHR